MQRRPFLSIEDILGLKPSKTPQHYTNGGRCYSETSPGKTTDHKEEYLRHLRCSTEEPAFVPWQPSSYYTGYTTACYKRKPYWQQYFVAYSKYCEFKRYFNAYSFS